MLKVLLIEDDELLGQGLEIGLQQLDFLVERVCDGLQARRCMRDAAFDCVVLDLTLPGLSGMQLLNEWRHAGNEVPVVILTARDAISERIDGLDSGADDYVIKPVAIGELAARIRAVYRRRGGQALPVLKRGELELDPVAHSVVFQGQPLHLPGAEFRLLQTLLEHDKRVSTREYLERTLYGHDEAKSNTIEVHIHALRRKLGKSAIKTIRGVGYILA